MNGAGPIISLLPKSGEYISLVPSTESLQEKTGRASRRTRDPAIDAFLLHAEILSILFQSGQSGEHALSLRRFGQLTRIGMRCAPRPARSGCLGRPMHSSRSQIR